MQNAWILVPINRTLRQQGLKAMDMFRQWDDKNRGRLTVPQVCEGLQQISNLRDGQMASIVDGDPPVSTGADHAIDWRG